MYPNENRRILVVDDEPEIREGYKSALSPEKGKTLLSSRSAPNPNEPPAFAGPDFEVFEAESGEQALEIFKSQTHLGLPFACAIVDVRMPGKMDGLQFIREAWKISPQTRMVVATAYQDRSVNEIDRLFGEEFQDHWDYLSKPFTAGEIIQKARQMVSTWNRNKREYEYLKQIESQQSTLVAQERLAAVGRLARSIGHEFGNVLQPLMTKLEIAKEKTQGQPELFSMMDEMLEAVVLGSKICQDLLTFSRETQNPENEKTLPKVSAASVVDKSLRLLRHELKKKDIQVTQQMPDVFIRAHEARLVQVVINLCTNSIHAMKDGGTLTVKGQAEGGTLRFQITDTGTGIKKQDLRHVFEPLFSTKGAQGNGLGLSVSKKIIEDYHGKIAVNSTEGKGTVVTIEFPIAT